MDANGGSQEWDVSVSRATGTGTLQIVVPAAVGRALLEKGFDRAVLRLTAEGLLFAPYASGGVKKRGTVELPF